MKIKNQIPNLLTLANLLCGLLIINAAFNHEFMLAAILAVAAMVFDFLDGTAARLLKVTSTIGKELDSLADMVSFGVAPSLVLYNYWKKEAIDYDSYLGYFGNGLDISIYTITFLIAAFAAYRLAKFNSTEQSTEYFLGLPTPAFSIACFSLPLAAEQFELANTYLNHPIFIIAFVILGGFFMISNVKLLSIKIGSKAKQLNILRILMLITCAVLIVFLKFFGVFLCLLVYLVFSLAAQKHL